MSTFFMHSIARPKTCSLTAAEALRYPAAQLFMERAAASGHEKVERHRCADCRYDLPPA